MCAGVENRGLPSHTDPPGGLGQQWGPRGPLGCGYRREGPRTLASEPATMMRKGQPDALATLPFGRQMSPPAQSSSPHLKSPNNSDPFQRSTCCHTMVGDNSHDQAIHLLLSPLLVKTAKFTAHTEFILLLSTRQLSQRFCYLCTHSLSKGSEWQVCNS